MPTVDPAPAPDGGLAPGEIGFGRFRLIPERKLLLADGDRVPLGARGFDMLTLLVERRDRFVGRDEIRAQVWRGLNVADNNVSVQMSRLRRCLGDPDAADAPIVSVPGRGYRFVAPLSPTQTHRDRDARPPAAVAATAPPVPVGPRLWRFGLLAVIALSFFWLGLRLSPAPPDGVDTAAAAAAARAGQPARPVPVAALLDTDPRVAPDDDDPNQ